MFFNDSSEVKFWHDPYPVFHISCVIPVLAVLLLFWRLVASVQNEDSFLSLLFVKLCHSSGILSNQSITFPSQYFRKIWMSLIFEVLVLFMSSLAERTCHWPWYCSLKAITPGEKNYLETIFWWFLSNCHAESNFWCVWHNFFIPFPTVGFLAPKLQLVL